MPEVTPTSIQANLPTADSRLAAELAIPDFPHTLVISMSEDKREKARDRRLSAVLNHTGCATLNIEPPAYTHDGRSSGRRESLSGIELRAEYLKAATHWASQEMETQDLPVALAGEGPAAAACLRLAALHPQAVFAVIARSPRTDLVEEALPQISCPVLLAVGENDPVRLRLAEQATRGLCCKHRLAVFAGVGLNFAEPEAWETYATLAANWLLFEAPYRASQAVDARHSLIFLGSHEEGTEGEEARRYQDWKRWTTPPATSDPMHTGPRMGNGDGKRQS